MVCTGSLIALKGVLPDFYYSVSQPYSRDKDFIVNNIW